MEHAVATAVTDLDANVLYHQVNSLNIAIEGGPGAAQPKLFLDGLVHAIETAIAASGVDRERLLGIGVGMAGVVDAELGLSRYSPFFGWQGVQIAEPLANHFKLAVYVENDVNTLTIAEQWFGYGHGVDHFIVVTVGRGVGAGIVVNGQFYRGAIGGAGEVGHMTLKPDGPRCDCGKNGCLEALASDDAIVRLARESIAAGAQTILSQSSAQALTVEAVVQAADNGDQLARHLLAEAGRWLGTGIANLVDVLNPQLVIVGGEGVRAGKWRIEPMREAILQHSFNGLVDELEIIIEPSGDEGWARGAACVVLGKLFASPLSEPVSGLLA
jgi:predicted NBD/HSP70 family sugar kinase